MAIIKARIGEAAASHRDELPGVTVGIKQELKHAKGIVITYFAVGLYLTQPMVRGAAGAGDELPYSARYIQCS